MAVGPLTAKLLAQAAINAATNKETRRRTLTIKKMVGNFVLKQFVLQQGRCFYR